MASKKIPTTVLRHYLQQRYLAQALAKAAPSSSANSAADEEEDGYARVLKIHNGEREGHKLLNNVYVLAHKSKAKAVKALASLPEKESEKEERVSVLPSSNSADPIVVLLGHKARGFGTGLWNGFGGKVDVGIDASITASAARELEEEVGLRLVPEGVVANDHTIGSVCRHVGILFFQYPFEKQPLTFEVHIYCVDGDNEQAVVGQPTESEEMNPVRWFPCAEVPIDQMWADDPEWLPQLLSVAGREQPSTTNAATTNAGDPANTQQTSSTITDNISEAAFVGYIDFSTMSEVRGSCVLIGREAVLAVVRDLKGAGTDADGDGAPVENASENEEKAAREKALSHAPFSSPLLHFDNTVCSIH